MDFRVLKAWEIAVCKENCETYDRLKKVCLRKCANKECEYPLSALVEHFYSVEFEGKICDLCHTVEDSVRQQPGLREAHDVWKKEQAAKRRMLDSKNYL